MRPLEGVRVAPMVFADRVGLRETIRIDRADQQHARHAGGDGSVERLAHELRMKLEMIIGNSDEIDDGVDTLRSTDHRSGIIWVPNDDLGQRVRSEITLQCVARAADDTIRLLIGSKSSGNAVTDGASGAEEGDLRHGLMMVGTSDWLLVAGNW